MPDPLPDAAPVACALREDDLAQRLRRWQALAVRARLDVVPIEQGLRLRFRTESGVEAELRDLAALEMACCPFADWTVQSEDDAYVMGIRGNSPQAVAVVQSMFAEFRSSEAEH